MAEVKVDLTGQLAQFDATLTFSGDEVLDTISGPPIIQEVPVDQFSTYQFKFTVQMVKVVPPPAPPEG